MSQIGSNRSPRIAAIDALRGLAILGVVAFHSSFIGPQLFLGDLDFSNLAINIGRFGVQLFFVVSGLTLTLSLRKRMDFTATAYFSYLIRRFARLSPVYYAMLLITFLSSRNEIAKLPTYFIHLLYLHGLWPEHNRDILPQVWSLTPEVIFYLLLPLILFWFRKPAAHLALFLITFLLADLFATYWTQFLPVNKLMGDWIFLSPYTTFWLLLGGILCADVLVWRQTRTAGQTKDEWTGAANILFACSVFFFYWINYRGGDLLLIWLTMVGVVMAYSLQSTWLGWLLSFAPLQYLGRISYSIFLIHLLVGEWFAPWVINNLAGQRPLVITSTYFSLMLGVSILLSALTYRFVELPGIALGERASAWLMARRLERQGLKAAEKVEAS